MTARRLVQEVRPPRRRGRPPLCEGPTEQLAVLLPQPVYDALSQTALRRRVSMGELVRLAVERHILHPQN